MTFDDAFKILLKHEGSLVFDPMDPGGQTKFGLSKRAYQHLDIDKVTIEDAQAIYKKDYWAKIRAIELPKIIRYSVFDAAVNAGNRQAILWLQRSAGVKDDGVLGPKTLAAVRQSDPYKLVCTFNGQRLRHFTDLKTFPRFGRGWARRLADNLVAA
jgi:lysozyme family protein|tara:strand:+ start:587 stop:1054 length:468 start_codon:yes stop_codon:yes gene_type:complete